MGCAAGRAALPTDTPASAARTSRSSVTPLAAPRRPPGGGNSPAEGGSAVAVTQRPAAAAAGQLCAEGCVSETARGDEAAVAALAARARSLFSRAQAAASEAVGAYKSRGSEVESRSLAYLRLQTPSDGLVATPSTRRGVPPSPAAAAAAAAAAADAATALTSSPLSPAGPAASPAATATTHRSPLWPDPPEDFAAMYEVGEAIGIGDRSTVHAGVERATGRPVAIKVVSRNATRSESRATATEIEALAACAHPHVVALHAVSHVGRETYLALERCEGDLMRVVAGAARPAEAEVARMMRQGFAHLDVKPSNVLLAPDGGVRLGDFTVAARVPTTRRRRTPLFAAPEMLTDGAVTVAADAWSYGVLVYTLLAGFPPFFPRVGGTPAELTEQVIDLISRLLVVDASARMTVQQALAHPWLLAAAM